MSANITFRAQINAAHDSGLDANPTPGAWAEYRNKHWRDVIDANAEYMRRCGRDVAECSHLRKSRKEEARAIHHRYRALMSEWLDLLEAAGEAAQENEDELRHEGHYSEAAE